MGRHSAPDDDDETDIIVAARTGDSLSRPGRHARAADETEAVSAHDTESAATQETAPRRAADEAAATRETAPPGAADAAAATRQAPEAESAAAVGKVNRSTAADLALLRARADVRARVIAAILVPLILYTLVMYLAEALDGYFLWIWVPLVTAGVVAGGILDAAHRTREGGGPPP